MVEPFRPEPTRSRSTTTRPFTTFTCTATLLPRALRRLPTVVPTSRGQGTKRGPSSFSRARRPTSATRTPTSCAGTSRPPARRHPHRRHGHHRRHRHRPPLLLPHRRPPPPHPS